MSKDEPLIWEVTTNMTPTGETYRVRTSIGIPISQAAEVFWGLIETDIKRRKEQKNEAR